jgi:hypothetical protein
LYLFCGARGWNFQNSVVAQSRLANTFYVWRTGKSKIKKFHRGLSPFSFHISLFIILIALILPFYFFPPLLLQLSLESTLRFRSVDWSWYFLNLPARNGQKRWNYSNSDASSTAVKVSSGASVIPFMTRVNGSSRLLQKLNLLHWTRRDLKGKCLS